MATDSTNGINVNTAQSDLSISRRMPGGRFALRPRISSAELQRHPVSVQLADAPPSDIVLPPPLQPASPVSGMGVAEFFLLNDSNTGVLALGSFDEPEQAPFMATLLSGLKTLKSKGATQLIVDVVSLPYSFQMYSSSLSLFQTNNGGGEFLRSLPGPFEKQSY